MTDEFAPPELTAPKERAMPDENDRATDRDDDATASGPATDDSRASSENAPDVPPYSAPAPGGPVPPYGVPPAGAVPPYGAPPAAGAVPPYGAPPAGAVPPYGTPPAAAGAVPPYGAGAPGAGAYPPPGYGGAVPPASGPAIPYAGAGYPPAAQGTLPPVGPPAPGTPDTRPKTLAIVALALAGAGAVMSFIPFVNWFAWVLLLAGLVIGIVALASRRQGGKPLSIAAIAVSVVGWIVSVVMVVVSLVALAGASRDIIDGSGFPDGTVPSPTAEAGDVEELKLVEVAYGRESFDPTMWWYVAVFENPDADHVYDSVIVDVEALDAADTILDSATSFATILPGRTAVTGTFTSIGSGEIAALNVGLPAGNAATRSPADETGAFGVEGVQGVSDEYSTTVTGTISSTFDADQEFIEVVVVARNPAGAIVGGAYGYVDRVPAGGKAQFDVMFFTPVPADSTFEVYPRL